MSSEQIWTICLCVFIYSSHCSCFEPLTSFFVATGIALSATFAGWKSTECVRKECCGDSWINLNSTALDEAFQNYLFGQHLVKFVVPRALKASIRNKNPKKALVMSFHGWTGSGKNYVSKMIADSLYKEGSKSQFVHWYVSTQHFPHKQDVRKYRDKLQKEIPEFTKQCGRSLFIFDEMDKMPPGVIDVLKPYLDFHEHVDGIDYRKNIFIFLSNAGGSDITRITYNFWLDGKEREHMTMEDIETLVNKGAFNEKGGLQKSEIVSHNLIDVYIPFLPLERKHVKKCIESELKMQNRFIREETVEKIASQLIYHPPEFELFSASGCKKVPQKIDIYGDEDS